MYIVEGRIISPELFTRQFVCNLDKCKGACCWEGDYGAPVKKEEVALMEESMAEVSDLLSKRSIDIVSREGVAPRGLPHNQPVTPLHKDGSCVYLFRDEDGISKCAFEKRYTDGRSTFKKPISCHLYPIRVRTDSSTGMEMLEYDEWDICSAACSLGEELKVPVFRFAKESLTRAYGSSFYTQLESIYESYFCEDK